MSLAGVKAAARGAAASVVPYSASPQRADPRPPTCRSIALDLARQLERISGGDSAVTCAVLEHTRAALPTAAWPAPEPSKKEIVAAQLLASMKGYVTGALAMPNADGDDATRRGGTRPKEAH